MGRDFSSTIFKIGLGAGFILLGVFLAYFLFDDKAAVTPAPVEPLEAEGKRLPPQLPASAPLAKSIDVILRAVENGDTESLQLIRSDLLRGFSEYEKVILPSLKERALKNFLKRRTEQDRTDWTHASFSEQGKPSSARLYVDDIWTVNPELGVFLETSAALFFRLYANTQLGQPFDEHAALEEVFAGGANPPRGRSISGSYTRTITVDPIFREIFERERAALIVTYIRRHPRDLTQHLELIFSVEPRFAGRDLLDDLVKILTRLAIEASPKLRERVFTEEAREGILEAAARFDPRVRRALAELLAVGAVDALEERDKTKTKERLNASLVMQKGLRSQRIIIDFLKELGMRESEFLLGERAQSVPTLAPGKSTPRSGGVPWLWIIVLGVLGAVGLLGSGQLIQRIRDALEERRLRAYTPAVTTTSSQPFTDWRLDESTERFDTERKTGNNPETE